MAIEQSLLRDLLLYTRDGEWGADTPGKDLIPMRVIRGTDFHSAKLGDSDSFPVRYIAAEIAERKVLHDWDVLIETAGGSKGRPTGRTVLIRPRLIRKSDLPLTCASFARFMRADQNKVVPEYLYWYLQYLYRSGQMEQHQVQHTGVARFQFTRFAETVEIPLPRLAKQRGIAHVLGALDDKIELNRRMKGTLESTARALFKSWFVDFDPARAKAEGRDPGLPAHIASLFPDSLDETEAGEIPRGWEVRSLDEIARFLNGLALQRFPPKDGRSLPVIKIAQLRAGTTDGADSASADLDSDYIVEDGDVLFSWSGSLECVLWAGGRGALNQHLFKVTSKDYPKWFYYLWIHKHLSEFRHIAAAKATTMGHIQRHHLSEAKVVLPSAELLDAAGQVIGPLVESIPARSVQSRSLSAVRDLLLPKLLSGEVRVRDIDGSVGVQP